MQRRTNARTLFPSIRTSAVLAKISLWVGADDLVFNQMLIAQFPTSLEVEGRQTILILLAQIHNIAEGIVVGQPEAWILSSAEKLTAWRGLSDKMVSFVAVGLSLAGGVYGVTPLNSAPIKVLLL